MSFTEKDTDKELPKFDVKAFALELRKDIEKNRIRLPTLPNISLEALIVINDADSSMGDLENVIAKDTSMAARLVRYANSPLYMGVNNVSSVKAAITRIGLDAVKNAILSLAMRDVFSSTRKSIEDRMELEDERLETFEIRLRQRYARLESLLMTLQGISSALESTTSE